MRHVPFRSSLAIGLLAVTLLFPLMTNAAHPCCICTSSTDPNARICLNSESECSNLPSLSKNESVKTYTCTSSPDCKTIAAGGTCTQGPVEEMLYKPLFAPVKPAEGGADKTVTVTAPNLSVSIPGLVFATKALQQGDDLVIPFFAQYVAALYKFLITIASLAAAVMIVYGGFLYVVGATGAKVKQGKGIIVDALVGLILVMGAYVILSTVNPATLELNAIRLPFIKQQLWLGDEEKDLPEDLQGSKLAVPTAPGAPTPAIASNITLPKAVCSGTSCKSLCDGCNAKADLPEAPNIASAKDLVAIPSAPGLKGSGYMRREAVDALVRAGAAAQAWPGGPYTIHIHSTARPLSAQVALACAKFCTGKDAEVGVNVATPGGSLHGSGLAADLELYKDTTKLVTCCTVATQTTDTKKENAELFQQIMGSVGWVRYCTEVWHFEWGTDGIPARSKSCPWPPQ
jgi:D-alanyl-D-alanine dipeptidase